MRFPTDTTVRSARVRLAALLACTVCIAFAAVVPVAQATPPPAFGVEGFIAANCSVGHEKCGQEGVEPFIKPKEPTKAEAEAEGYTQAAGHPPYGVTYFKINTIGEYPNAAPTGIVTHVRTDVGPGVSTNPQAMEKCSFAEFGGTEAIPGTGFYPEPKCKKNKGDEEGTEIGVNKVLVYTGAEAFPKGGDVPVEGTAYNLEQPNGLASDFGVALKLPTALSGAALKKGFEEAEEKGAKPGVDKFPSLPEQAFLEAQQYYAHTFIEGSVEWAGNYHDYYEINVSPKLPLIASRLTLYGNIGTTKQGGFITNPSNCAPPGVATTSTVTLTSLEGQISSRKYEGPVGTEGCAGKSPFSPVPFAPTFTLKTETTQSDQPTGMTTELTLPHAAGPEEIDSSQLENATITLPEGMTLNPSAAHGLEACTPAQIGLGTRNAAKCPYGSKIGTVTINVPDLPPESLKGSIYLGGSESGQITGQPYIAYLNAESARYGVTVRLKGSVTLNETTGRVTASFEKNPEQPFSEVILHFKDGPLAPIANPLACGTATTTTKLVPYIGAEFTQTPSAAFTVDSNGSGGACASPLPFAPTQSTRKPARDRRGVDQLLVHRHAALGPAVPLADQDRAAGRPRRADPRGVALHRSAGRRSDRRHRRLPGLQPDRLGHGARWSGLRALPVHRLGLPDRPLQRRALRPRDRGARQRRSVQPRQRGHARDDQRRTVHLACGRGRQRARDLQGHPAAACRASTSKSTARASCSTRPAAQSAR